MNTKPILVAEWLNKIFVIETRYAKEDLLLQPQDDRIALLLKDAAMIVTPFLKEAPEKSRFILARKKPSLSKREYRLLAQWNDSPKKQYPH